MTRTAYLVIGCPGAGKSWVCDQLEKRFKYVHHDLFIGMTGPRYLEAIQEAAKEADQPLLIEAPFSISQIKDPLELLGFKVIPVFIQEDHRTLSKRYLNREGRAIPQGHLTRQHTYADRAKKWKSFSGTAEQVLEHLQTLSQDWRGHWG